MAPPGTHTPPFAAYPPAPSVPVYPQPNDPIPSLDDISLLEDQLRERKGLAHATFEKVIRDLGVLGKIMEKVEKENEKKEGGTKKEEKEVRLGSLKPAVPRLVVTPDRDMQMKDSSTTPRSSVQPRKVIVKGMNKNKRKRVDSDEEDSYAAERPTPASPPPSYPKHKHTQHPSSAMVKHKPVPRDLPNMADESYWRLPERTSLIPPHPPPPDPPIPGPLRQQDVDIDLSDAKPPASQITADTFWKSVEPYIRDLGEEDVAAMSYIDDDPEPFIIPPLGKHYLDRWADEDAGMYIAPGSSQSRGDAKGQPFPPTQGYDPTDLGESDWLSEEKSLGPVAERLVTALQPKNPDAPPGADEKLIEAIAEELQVEDALSAGPLGDLRVSAEELDVRIKKQLKELGLWTDQEPDYSAPEDDSVLAELRQCERLLKDQMSLNAARKYRLLKRCEDRLAYQDYVHQLERMDEQILSEYQKLTKKAAQAEKKGHARHASTSSIHKMNGKERASTSHSPSVDPSASGSGSGGELGRPKAPVSAELLHAVRIRQRLVDELGSVFEQGEKECPGRFWGLPEGSLYKGISVEEGRNVLRRVNVGHPALM